MHVGGLSVIDHMSPTVDCAYSGDLKPFPHKLSFRAADTPWSCLSVFRWPMASQRHRCAEIGPRHFSLRQCCSPWLHIA